MTDSRTSPSPLVPAPPEAGTDLPALETDVSRWHVKAASVKECVEQLSDIWMTAAEQADHAAPSAELRERALADPRMARHVDEAERGSVRVRMRTSVLTLVVIASQPETAERSLAAINALNQRHPSRAIVVSPGDFDGPATMNAHIYAACKLSERSGAEMCTEEILIKTGGELSQHLSRVVTPLLIHDLPVVLWWPDDPPFGSRQFNEVVGTADRLLVDSGSFHEDGGKRLAGMATVVSSGTSLSDIGWLRLTLWRELMAGLFDHPLLIPELEHIRHVRIDIASPSSTLRVTKAAFYCGWLASRLGWEVKQPLGPSGKTDDDTLRGSFRDSRRREILVELRPVRVTLDGSKRAPGSLVRVEIEAQRQKNTVRARITRQSDHLLATADWNGAQVTRRAGRLEPFDETPFVAEALERRGLDRIFEGALIRAVRFVGS